MRPACARLSCSARARPAAPYASLEWQCRVALRRRPHRRREPATLTNRPPAAAARRVEVVMDEEVAVNDAPRRHAGSTLNDERVRLRLRAGDRTSNVCGLCMASSRADGRGIERVAFGHAERRGIERVGPMHGERSC
eukprot:4063987-Prymnesium_polylepis.1